MQTKLLGNYSGLHEPAQRHGGHDANLLTQRCAVYEAAKQAMPERWRGRAVRNWELIKEVWLNPDKPQQKDEGFWRKTA